MKEPTKRALRRKGGHSALIVLAVLLAVSGVLRLGDGIEFAMARAASGGDADLPGNAAPALNCPLPPAALAEALSAREAKVAAKEVQMAERLTALAMADKLIEERLAELTDAEAKLSATLVRADGASEADLTRLTDVYQSMKPKDATALFAAMAPEFAAGFLARMRPDASAAVLSGMTPENAYAISAILAGRHANVPKE
jgi:flagellar motility protein MotE (MotC chaperone)